MAEKLYKSLSGIDKNSKAGKNIDFNLLTYISKFEYDYGRNILPKLKELESEIEKNRKKLEKVRDNEEKNKIVKIIKDNEEKVEIIKELRNKFMEEIDDKKGNFLTKYMRIVLNYIIYLNRK